MPDLVKSRREDPILIGIFCVALVVQFSLTTFNWTTPFMPRHEFRQAQTAIVSYYIDQQNNFSLLYETPILGKPWVSILLEVPIYEWSVVLLSRAVHVPHFMAARTISLACFYLALPAFYLLLGRLALSRPRRLLVLALILTCPVYIFYSRAFLMDSMAFMGCAWFLLGFVRTMDERSWAWLALTTVAGTGAALVKSVTFAVWLVPAAAYGAWLLWRAIRAHRGWREPLSVLLWGASTVVVAFASLRAWINFTDPLKAAHASAWIFTAKNLSQGNWGLIDFASAFSPRVWGILLERWREAIANPWLILAGLVIGLGACRTERWRALGLAAPFFFAQLMFPYAYAYQDYYFYAAAVFLVAAFGLLLVGVLDSRLPRWGCAILVALPFCAQLTTYWQGYRVDQVLVSEGGFNYTSALRDITPRESVIIVAGADWAAMVPLYSQRKALMIRNGLEENEAYLKRAFDDLADEDVCALVLIGPQRTNRKLLELAATRFNLDASSPTCSQSYTDLYFSRPYIESVQIRLGDSALYPAVTFTRKVVEKKAADAAFDISLGMARASFANVSPAPFRAQFSFGLDHVEINGGLALSAHPNSDVWLRTPAHATHITWAFGLIPNAYLREGFKSDGVEFLITGETADGSRREIYRRILDPVQTATDRGPQLEVIPYQPRPGEILQFSDRPNHNNAFDWTYWSKIEVK